MSDENSSFRIRCWGDLLLLPTSLQSKIKQIELDTINNKSGNLNVCFGYTSTNEITLAIQNIVSGFEDGSLKIEDLSKKLLDEFMYSKDSLHLDLIIRTSGEVRLSDFMLWQSSSSLLVILDVLWPEFKSYHLYYSILKYQKNFDQLEVLF